jgi:hypothetical protein
MVLRIPDILISRCYSSRDSLQLIKDDYLLFVTESIQKSAEVDGVNQKR